jgi:hypothetical protein
VVARSIINERNVSVGGVVDAVIGVERRVTAGGVSYAGRVRPEGVAAAGGIVVTRWLEKSDRKPLAVL